jgi:hypothetical protein
MDDGPKYRISIIAGVIIVAFAGFLDLGELILDLVGTSAAGVGVVVGILIDFLKVIGLPTIFLFRKAPFWKGKKAKKKMVRMITAFLVGVIPGIGAILPETLIGTIATIILTRKEDNEKAGKTSLVSDRNITRAKRIREKLRKK